MADHFSQRLNKIFADAYHAAALREADMQALAAVLEALRGQLKSGGNSLDARAALDTAVGGNSDAQAGDALQRLRAAFVGQQKEAWIAELKKAFDQSPAEAWALFLRRYVEAFSFWRTQLMLWWADAALGETYENSECWFGEKADELRNFQRQSLLLEHGRWPEAYPFLRELAVNQLLTARLRAHLWTVCGSIQMYYNTLPDAEHDLAEAEKLFPELPYLTVCRADLERIAGRYERSREILKEHLGKYPHYPEALVAQGRSFAEEQNLEDALRCFDDAIAADPGNASGYRNKLSIWGKNEAFFQKNKEKIPKIVALADRADPESAINNLLEAGYTCQAGSDFEAAADYFKQAQNGDPERVEPLTALGYLCQAQQRYEEAAEWYKEVLRLAPGATDGYWNLAALCAAQGQHLQAAAWYEKALPNCPMFTRTLLVKAGEMYIAAGDFEKGKKSCLESLKMDPSFDYALNTLHDLSDKLRDKGHKDKTGTVPALDVLAAVRAVKGESYEASFQNRSGNVYYYFGDYQTAAEHYRAAVAADAQLAVYHDNLSGSLGKLVEQTASLPMLTEALQAAQMASQLEPANEDYQQSAARLERKLISTRHFGVLPEERSADISPVRVRFRDELYPWLVKDGDLVPELMEKIEALREKFKKDFSFSVPGIRFSTDWNIAADANFVIDLDGIPVQQGWLEFEGGENGLEVLMGFIEQHIRLNLADFMHYDSPEISSKFVGKSSAHAAGFFQVVRMLLKQKIAVADINTIHEIYDAGVRAGKSVQAISQDIRGHSAIKPSLPVNKAAVRALVHLTPEQEDSILRSAGKSVAGQLLWQIRPNDPTFFEILKHLPQNGYAPSEQEQFVVAQNPTVATLLADLQPGLYFGRDEVLNLTEGEKSATP